MSPGVLDTAVVRRHLAALRQTVVNLERHQGKAASSLASADLRWIVERGLQLCAQNALDMATHIAASRGVDVPDYASAVDALTDLGVLPRDFAARFRGIAGFRNVVVHGYLAVDTDLLHALLNERLADFEVFARHLEAYLRTLEGG